MAVKDLDKKLEKLALPASKEARDKAEWRQVNRGWLRKSFEIALHIQSAIKSKGWNQKKLAEAMGVSPQQVSKIVGGKENFTLQTIAKLESILDTKLIETHLQPAVKGKTRKTAEHTSAKAEKRPKTAGKQGKRYGETRKVSKAAEPGKGK